MEENKENNQQEQQKLQLNNKVKNKVEEKIDKILDMGIQSDNVDYLYKLVDIHKDIENEDYWKVKKEGIMMRYREGYGRDEYGARSYGRRGVPGSGRGRYSARGRYRGEDMIEEMKDNYMNYSEAYEEMNRGNYGAESDMVDSVETIMKNIYEIVDELSQADSPEVTQIIKKYSRKISEM